MTPTRKRITRTITITPTTPIPPLLYISLSVQHWSTLPILIPHSSLELVVRDAAGLGWRRRVGTLAASRRTLGSEHPGTAANSRFPSGRIGYHPSSAVCWSDGRGVGYFDKRIGVPKQNPAGRPTRRPADREISAWQNHEGSSRKFPGGGVSGGHPNDVSRIRRISQVPDQGGSIVDGASSDLAEGRRSSCRHDQPTSLGQRTDAGDAGNLGQ
jgi:hypothetical protein